MAHDLWADTTARPAHVSSQHNCCHHAEWICTFQLRTENQSKVFWFFSLVLMRRPEWFWKALHWHEWSYLAVVCRHFRRARLVAMLTGHIAAASWYWSRLDSMNQSSTSGPIIEHIMWYHDVRMNGNCAEVLQRVGELHDVRYDGRRLYISVPLP